METTTLYYFFSTTAQVLAAISALLPVFTHFKITEIKESIIGDGIATLNRWEKPENGYPPPIMDSNNYFERLEDSVGRKSINGIHDVIKKLAEFEKNQSRSLKDSPRGLQ